MERHIHRKYPCTPHIADIPPAYTRRNPYGCLLCEESFPTTELRDEHTTLCVPACSARMKIAYERDETDEERAADTTEGIRDFGDENLDYITPEFALKCFNTLMDHDRGLTNMVYEIFMNEDHPENRNVKMVQPSTKKSKYVKDGQWVYCHISGLVEIMKQKAFDTIMTMASQSIADAVVNGLPIPVGTVV